MKISEICVYVIYECMKICMKFYFTDFYVSDLLVKIWSGKERKAEVDNRKKTK